MTTADFALSIETLLDIDPTNPNDSAHIVKRTGDMGASELIEWAAATGTEIEGLCGHRWVPVGIAPDHLDACTACLKAWESLDRRNP